MSLDKEGLAAIQAAFMRIDDFVDEFEFLDLSHPCAVHFRGLMFPSAMHGVYFTKYVHTLSGRKWCYKNGSSVIGDGEECAGIISKVSASDLELLSSDKELNPGWVNMRCEWLESILRDKYKRNNHLREKLLNTGNRGILYRSSDLFMGSDGRNGQNKVGEITEKIRADIINYTDHLFWLSLCAGMCDGHLIINIEEYKTHGVIREYNLSGKSCYTFGRIPSCDITALNPSVSRIHASIYFGKGARVCFVSYNDVSGAKLNGEQIEHHICTQLRDGDVFSLGTSSRKYKVMIDEDMLEQRAKHLEKKRRELSRKAEMKAKEIDEELKTYLEGNLSVVVLNVAFKTKRVELFDFFSPCGEIDCIRLPQDRRHHEGSHDMEDDDTEAKRGVAFITFKDRKSAAKALEKDGNFLNYRRIQVKYAMNDRWKNDRCPKGDYHNRKRSERDRDH